MNAVYNYNPEQSRDECGKFTSGGSSGINPNYKKELKQVIEKARNNPDERQKLVIGKVSEDLAALAKDNGLDIEGYNHDLDVSGTRHAIKEHGQEKTEIPRGQVPITDEDFEKIPDIVYHYDNVIFGETDNKNTPLIKYVKSFDDGTILYVEEARTRQRTLTIKSMWKHHKKNSADNSCTFTELIPQRPEYISNIIITDNTGNFNPCINNRNKKEKTMTILDKLKDLIISVENDKGEDEMAVEEWFSILCSRAISLYFLK